MMSRLESSPLNHPLHHGKKSLINGTIFARVHWVFGNGMTTRFWSDSFLTSFTYRKFLRLVIQPSSGFSASSSRISMGASSSQSSGFVAVGFGSEFSHYHLSPRVSYHQDQGSLGRDKSRLKILRR
ncbi:hypothetical protein RIF29_39405 [Crotalaria pallida]|uniref:Uncharacterized protein n=1 Tax=Crotalaria pallida TaxID=3830 RepID=A0AAN9E205_CROPI